METFTYTVDINCFINNIIIIFRNCISLKINLSFKIPMKVVQFISCKLMYTVLELTMLASFLAHNTMCTFELLTLPSFPRETSVIHCNIYVRMQNLPEILLWPTLFNQYGIHWYFGIFMTIFKAFAMYCCRGTLNGEIGRASDL